MHVVAFDGQIVDTLPLRTRALDEALASVAGFTGGDLRVAGRDFAEAARLVLERLARDGAVPDDAVETLVDLVSLDAGRRYSALLSHGVSLALDAEVLLATLQRTGRVVARADSARRDVSSIMALGALEHVFMFIRCSDDAPRLPGASTLESSMAAISARVRPAGEPRDASPIYHP